MEPTQIDFSLDAIRRRWPTIASNQDDESADKNKADRERQRIERERITAAGDFLRRRGARYHNCRLSNYDATTEKQKKLVESLKQYLVNLESEVAAGNGIVLFGPSGTGKDHLLVAMGYAAIRTCGYSVEWRNGSEMFSDMRDVIAGTKSESDVLGAITRSDLAILSDPLPPKGSLTEYQSGTLYRLLEKRYSAMRPTWVSINVSGAKEASERLGVPCHDRLRHGSLCFYCDWQTYRKPRS